MDGLALNTIYNKETGKTEFCKSRQILVLCGQAKSAAASDSGPGQGVQRPRFPELWWQRQQQQQWTLQRAGWPVVTPVVDTSLAFPPKLMRTRSPTHPALFLAPPCLFLLTLYLLVCFRATAILIRKSWKDILAQKWCTSESNTLCWQQNMVSNSGFGSI